MKPVNFINEDAERYQWLRDGKSDNARYCGSAPYVICPNKSKLYAMHKLRSESLDVEIDTDIIDTKVNALHRENYVVENELMPYPVNRDSEEYTNVLYESARKILGWTKERAARVEEYRC